MKSKHETQLIQILRALQEGSRTSIEIAAVCGFTVKCVAAYLYSLRKKECIRRTGSVRFHDHQGPLAATYELLPHGEAEFRRRLKMRRKAAA